jgi:calcium/calmodulin-dependent protein kinase (CaM kinase) II
MEITESEIIDLTKRLVESITQSDWQTYAELCADDLTAIEPEALGHLVQGMAFHKHYFDLADGSPYANVTTTISSPHVRLMGDAAVIAYVRLTQRVGGDGETTTSCSQETRVWQRVADRWQHVHFHRS